MVNKNINKFFNMIVFMVLITFFTAFLLTILGLVDLRIVNTVTLNPIIECILNIIMFTINMFFLFSVNLQIFDKKIIRIILCFVPFYIIILIFGNSELGLLFSTLLPVLYVLLYGILKLKFNAGNLLLSLGIFTLGISIYQKITEFIKFHSFGAFYKECNSITYLLLSIDLYLLYSLIYLGVKKYVQIMVSRKFSVFSETQSVPENAEPCEDSLNLQGMNNRQRFIFWCMAIGYQIFQLAVVLLIGLINNVFIELLIMLVVFWGGRSILRKSWHSDSLTLCSIITFSGFYILTKLTFPLSVSLFSCIILSALFVFILYCVGIHFEIHEQFIIDKCKRDEYANKTRRGRAKIILKTLSSGHIDYDILTDYSNGETLEILADKYNISASTLNRKINALTQK